MTTRIRVRRQPWFRLAVLAASIGPTSIDQTTRRVALIVAQVSQQPVRDFTRHDFPIFADRTVSIKRPADLEVRCELMLFQRSPANIPWLRRRLLQERYVSRVDVLAGAVNLIAEIVAPNRAEADALVQRYEPEGRLLLEERRDMLRRALMANARWRHSRG